MRIDVGDMVRIAPGHLIDPRVDTAEVLTTTDDVVGLRFPDGVENGFPRGAVATVIVSRYEEARALASAVDTDLLPKLLRMGLNDVARRATCDEVAAREARTVRPLDITLDLGPSSYGTLASPHGMYQGRPALLLRLVGGNGRYGDRFSVLYMADAASKPYASLIPQATVIASRGTGALAPIMHDVNLGDIVIVDGHRLTVTDGTFSNYPALLSV